MEWSDVKKEVFAFESDVVVSAGAGSGKTAALVELYLRLLAGETSLGTPLEVEEIVAITFTEKAALEMKERVRAGVLERLSASVDRKFWEVRRRAMHAAAISTFHAFCSRILRENPAEAGVDPSFTLLDEQSSEAELQEALDEVIEGELRNRSEDIRTLLRQFPLSGRGHGRGLREHLASLHWQLSGSGSGLEELNRLSREWEEKAQRLFMAERDILKGLMGEVRRILRGKPLQFHERLTALPDLCDRAGLLPVSGVALDEIAAMQACVGGGWGKEKPVRDGLLNSLETLELCCRQILAAPLASALIRLASKVGESYRARKDTRGLLDFDDLQRKTRDLLERDQELRNECRRRFKVVMVDEFQDTNPLQKELVGLLAGPGQRLFIVGDPKQSIYLFRGADVSVFSKSQREIADSGGRNLYFQESFRSRQGIIEFVNGLFGAVMRGGEADFEVSYREGDHLAPQRRDWDGTPCVEYMLCDDSGGAGERREAEAAAMAAKIVRLVSGRDGVMVYDRKSVGGEAVPAFIPRPPRFGDIAILFRRFSNLKVYEHELRRRGIPYYVVKGRGFYRCQEVLDILNFLSWLEFSGDHSALAGLLRSPLCGISDETLYLLSRVEGGLGGWEKQLFARIDPVDQGKLESLSRLVSRLRPLRDRLTIAELLEEILTGTDFASILLTTFQGGQKVANLRKLIELSRTYSEREGGSLRRFVNYLAELVEKEPTEAEALVAAEGEDVVRLMTIHQSKGLEFPVVFIPELGMTHPPTNSPVLWEEALGIGLRSSSPGSPGRPTLAWQEIGALLRRKEGAELQRLLYVAVTRARDYLILSGEGKGEWRRWVGDFLDGDGGRLVRSVGADAILEESVPLPAAGNEGDAERVLPDRALFSAALRRALHYTPPLPSEMTFSPTALEDYRTCPRKYFYKAVLGLDEGLFAELFAPPFKGGKEAVAVKAAHGAKGVKGERNRLSAIDRGNLAHLLLERMDFGASMDSRRVECERLGPLLASSPDEAGVAEVIETVMAFAGSPLAGELGGRMLHREYPFILKLKGKADFLIRGTMDLVAVTEERAVVYDYKYLARENADLEGYRFQLRTYMLVLARAFPQKTISGQLLFLRSGEAEEVTCDFAAFEGELKEIMEGIRERGSETDFDLRGGCDGSHCPFRQRCLGKLQG